MVTAWEKGMTKYSRLILYSCLLWPVAGLPQDGETPSASEMQQMEDSMKSLQNMLKGLSGLKKELPNRSLTGIVHAVQDLDFQTGVSSAQGQCTAFGLLSLKSHSLESYPRGAWETKQGWVHAVVQRDQEFKTLSGRGTETWRADDIVSGNFGISTHDDASYSVSFSTAAVQTAIEHREPRLLVLNSVQGRCSINIDLHDLPLPQDKAAPLAGSGMDPITRTRVSWEFWPNECKADELKLSKSKDYGPIVQEGFAGEVQAAFIRAFRSRGVEAGPEHVTIINPEKDKEFFNFAIRVSIDHCVMPHMRAISQMCIKLHSQENALDAFIGGIQRRDQRTRATVRVVKIETAEIDDTGMGTVDGTDVDAIERAVATALDEMDYKITCAKGVNL